MRVKANQSRRQRTVVIRMLKKESYSEQGKGEGIPRGVAPTEDVKAADRTPTTGNVKAQQSSGQGSDPGNRELEVELKGQQHVMRSTS